MSQVGPTPAEIAVTLRRLLAPVADDMAAVERRLQAELRHSDPFIDELARHCFRVGGKRLRPALLLLAAQAVGEVNDDHRTLAAVVEMVHTATLVHDDVLDEAELRRHEETVNARWSNQKSVLLGDYLFTHAFYLASTLDTVLGCRLIGRATNAVCEGELRQSASSGDFSLAQADYLSIIDAKTAQLTACACELGAHFAGADAKLVARFASYGRNLGIAFQIIDDLLDLEGEEASVGKSLGTDLAHHKMTLPLILLRDQLAPAERARLQALCEEPDQGHAALLLDWLDRFGALQQARQVAQQFAQQAASELAGLPPSRAQATLAELASFVVNRNA